MIVTGVQTIRSLDLDDLLVLSLLLEGCRAVDIGRYMCLTPPAITHRLNKYKLIFGPSFFDEFPQNTKRKILSGEGRIVAERAKKALRLFICIDDAISVCNFLKIPTQAKK